MTVAASKSDTYQLTAAQIRHFDEQGWLGPFDAFSPEEVAVVKDCIAGHSLMSEELNGKKSLISYNNVYNLPTIRDLHLFHEPIAAMLRHPAIVRRLQQLESPDLLLWRSDVFNLMPHQGHTRWHQYREYYWAYAVQEDKPHLAFPSDSPHWNFTVWIALTDVPIEMGALQFAGGTHHQRFPVDHQDISPEESAFASYRSHKSLFRAGHDQPGKLRFEPEDWEIATVPARAGQIIIFTEAVVHDSLPNISEYPRLALNGSYIHPSVTVYPHRLRGDYLDADGHDMRRHFCLQVSGTDGFGVNVVRDRHDLSDIELAFQLASNLVRFDRVELPPNKLQLEIYGLEKQAIAGDCQEAEPDAILHPRKYIQWQAWQRFQGMSRTDAMTRYTALVEALPRKDRESLLQAEKAIGDWLTAYAAELLGMPTIDPAAGIDTLGLDSVNLIGMVGDLEDWLGCELEISVLQEHATIQSLAAHLATAMQGKVRTVYS